MQPSALSRSCLCVSLFRKRKGADWKPSVPMQMQGSFGSMKQRTHLITMHKLSHETDRETPQRQIPRTTAAQEGAAAAEETGCVAGVDIGGTNLRVALADMTGT